MSFNKIGNGYYNNDLCKCLLSLGGAYFVELKNGVKVNISKDDYDAMADGLLSVNGVKYCDPTLVASAKHIGAKYIVEFSNGNQFSISQSDYEGLIAAGFVAIGDIYYNPDDIDKVYAVAGGYFAEMVNGQKIVMTEEEYDAIVGGDQPARLTPFGDDDTITENVTKVQFNTNLDVPAVLNYINDSVLSYVNTGSFDAANILSTQDSFGAGVRNVLVAAKVGTVYILFTNQFEDVVFASDTIEGLVDTAGWQYGEDALDESGMSTVRETITLGYINPNAGNGVLFGKAEAEPAGGLAPFSVGQTISGIVIDPNAVPTGYESVDAYITAIGSNLLVSFEGGKAEIVTDGDNIIISDLADDGVVAYIKGQGWALQDSEEQIIPITNKQTFTCSAIVDTVETDFAPLNGVVLGAALAQ